MAALALTHRGCKTARGCGCLVDKSLDSLAHAESLLFKFELDSYADPTTPRTELINGERIVSNGDPKAKASALPDGLITRNPTWAPDVFP